MSISIERRRLFSGFDGNACKIDPKLSVNGDRAVLLWSELLLSGIDVMCGCASSVSFDGCKSFAEPKAFKYLDRFKNGIRYHAGTRELLYSRVHDKWIWFGSELEYANERHPEMAGGISLSKPIVAFIDPNTGLLTGEPRPIPFPFEALSLLPFGQFIEDDSGDLLISYYFVTKERPFGSVVTARYALEGEALRLVKIGEPIFGDDYYSPEMRGLCEPSFARLGDKYYITLRNDLGAYYAESDDGFHFGSPKHWTWDDGSLLESYNTMTRWVRFHDALYLVYTRRDKLNGHVFRNRAPLYMTRFDAEHGCLVKDEEMILVPELGARLGNFSVTDVSPTEAVVTVAEWMQPLGCEKYGADNSIWLVKLREDRA